MTASATSQPLFAGYDAALFTLPDELLAARSAVQQVADARPAPIESTDSALLEQAARNLAAGGDLDCSAIFARRDAVDHWRVATDVHIRAAQIADQALADTAASLTDTIIREHLRPAHVRTVEQARAAFAKLADIPEDTPTSQLAVTTKPVRDAWVLADELAAQWVTIRRARTVCVTLSGQQVQHDQYGWFNEIRNADTVRPWILNMGAHSALSIENDTVPVTPRARLRWYIEHGGDLWLPTLTEQDAANDRSPLGERRREHARNRHALAGWRALGEAG